MTTVMGLVEDIPLVAADKSDPKAGPLVGVMIASAFWMMDCITASRPAGDCRVEVKDPATVSISGDVFGPV
jgi:hypothetical protein